MSDKPTVVDDESEVAAIEAAEVAEISEVNADEPPVVARLVVEIRSDGSRTIARGALEERETGQSVAIEAVGGSPMQLALSLARVIAKTPLLARTATRAMLPKRPRRESRRARARRLLRRIRGGGDDEQ